MLHLLKKLKAWPKSRWFIVILLGVAAFYRLYNLSGTLQFQGDQGRDAIIVADIFRKKDLVFIGPVTSVGNLYLGPLYYYFMLPWLMLTYPSPIGPAYAVAILGILTVAFVYKFGKEMVGKEAALIAAAFMTFSSTVIVNTRFSWNPNPAPFVSILMIYFTYKSWKKDSRNWLWVAICFSVLIQLHYLTLLSLGGAGLIWLYQLNQTWKLKRKRGEKLKKLAINTLLALLIFGVSLTPLVLFDLKHDSLNQKAFIQMLTGEENFKQATHIPLKAKAISTLKETEGRAMHILFEISIGKDRQLNKALVYITAIVFVWLLMAPHNRKSDYHAGWVVIATYLGTGILGTALYEHTIFNHYIAYLFPVTFLTYGIVLSSFRPHLLKNLVLGVSLGYFLASNLPIQLHDTGWTLNDIRRTSNEISNHLGLDEKYNIVLLSESHDHYGQNYRYFLTTTENPPLPPETSDSPETLVIINEEQKTQNVTSLPIYDIVVFPNHEVSDFFTIPDGPEITILRKQ